jgi:ribose 5-phosphate isomerase B
VKIYLGADHNGFEDKAKIAEMLTREGHEVVDVGGMTKDENDDFPQFAGQVATALLGDNDKDARGILVCGSGQGMVMAANRFKGIRASLVWNEEEARSSRNDDDSNVLCMSAAYTPYEQMQSIIKTWLNTPFAAAPRFIRRLKELDNLN